MSVGASPERNPDFDLVTDFVESLDCDNPVEGYAVIAGAQFAVEAYAKSTAGNRHITFRQIIENTMRDIHETGLDDDVWKTSDEFIVGVALGAFIARRADPHDTVLVDNYDRVIDKVT